MKKLIALLVLSILVLFGCSSSSDEAVTLTYMNWNLGTVEENNIERQMIAAYEEANPNVTIEIVELDGGDYNEILNNMAAAGELPDVFAVGSLPAALKSGWLLDITDYVSDEFNNVVAPIQEAVTYEGAIVAMPIALTVMGYWINLDVAEALGVEPLTYGTYNKEDFANYIKATHKPEEGYVAITEVVQMPGLCPAFDEGQYYNGYDGETFSFNSPEYIACMDYISALYPYTWTAMSNEEKAAYGATEDTGYWWGPGWNANAIGMRFDGNWAMADMTANTPNYSFIGLPGGKSVVAADILGIASTTEHPEEAVAFAEWMGYAGWATRLELYTADPTVPGGLSLPPVMSEENITAYDDATGNIPGMKEALTDLTETGVTEPNKFAVGYDAAITSPTGITLGDVTDATVQNVIDAAVRGEINYADYAETLNTVANEAAAAFQAEVPAAPKFTE